jgi:ParB family transcriptional regulator, chromosome partitioning protein
MGHARAILGVDGEKTQLILLKKILERKLSVRQVEDLVRNAGQIKTPGHPALPDLLPARYEQARSGLRIRLESEVGMKVNRKGAGTIVIPFRSAADLDRIMAKLDT